MYLFDLLIIKFDTMEESQLQSQIVNEEEVAVATATKEEDPKRQERSLELMRVKLNAYVEELLYKSREQNEELSHSEVRT